MNRKSQMSVAGKTILIIVIVVVCLAIIYLLAKNIKQSLPGTKCQDEIGFVEHCVPESECAKDPSLNEQPSGQKNCADNEICCIRPSTQQ